MWRRMETTNRRLQAEEGRRSCRKIFGQNEICKLMCCWHRCIDGFRGRQARQSPSPFLEKFINMCKIGGSFGCQIPTPYFWGRRSGMRFAPHHGLRLRSLLGAWSKIPNPLCVFSESRNRCFIVEIVYWLFSVVLSIIHAALERRLWVTWSPGHGVAWTHTHTHTHTHVYLEGYRKDKEFIMLAVV